MTRTLTALALATLAAGCSPDGNTASVRIDGATRGMRRALQTPIQFQALVMKAELLRGLDDTNPGVIFDAEADPSQASLVDLTEAAQEIWSGDVPEEYLGTYTHARITVAAAGQEIDYVDTDGSDQTKGYVELFYGFDNSAGDFAELPSGELQTGDVLVAEGGGLEWFEIDADKVYSTSASRGDVAAYQDPSPANPVQIIELSEPLTIEAGGDYVLRADFDVSDTFEWNDRDSDAAFEPSGDDHDGTMNGFDFRIKQPLLDVYADAPVAAE